MANKRGFARAGQAHDDKDFALLNRQRHIVNTQRMAGFGQQLGFAHASFHFAKSLFGIWPENLGYVLNVNKCHRWPLTVEKEKSVTGRAIALHTRAIGLRDAVKHNGEHNDG